MEFFHELTGQFIIPALTCKRQLYQMLRDYPDVVGIRRSDNGLVQLYYHRKNLIERIRLDDQNDMILSSFERALKHAGMYVIQTTHACGAEIKIWQHRKIESTTADDDEEYLPSKYHQRMTTLWPEFNLDDSDLPVEWRFRL